VFEHHRSTLFPFTFVSHTSR